MKAILIQLLFFCSLTVIGQEIKGTTVMVSPDEYDFGRLQEGETYSTVYTLKNVSSVTRQIDDVITSCGCTVPKWEPSILNPGDVYQITVTFDTTNKKGYIRKTVVVWLDNDEKVHLNFTANVL